MLPPKLISTNILQYLFTILQFVTVTAKNSNSNITIRNASRLHIINVCNTSLTIQDSQNVFYTKHTTPRHRENTTNGASLSVGEQNPTCSNGGSITAMNTSFAMLVAKNLKLLKLSNCLLNELHTQNIEQMEVRTSFLHGKSATVTVTKNAIWENFHTSSIIADIRGNFHAVNISYGNVSVT